MAADFLLAGLATDGISNVAYRPKNIRELTALYGGNYRERFYVSTTATSLVMLHNPFSMPINEVDGRKQYLFAPYLDFDYRNIMYFGNIGGSAVHTVDLLYTPYLGKQDLIVAATRYYQETGKMPYVVRVGGEIASLSIDGWEFEAKYAGTRYNYLGLYSHGTSSITIFGMEPSFPRKTYAFTSVEEFYKQLERDYDLGVSPIIATVPGTAMISSGVYWFTGGTNGDFSDSDVNHLFTNYSFPLACNHILMLTEMTSSIVQTIADSLSERAQPRMFFVPSVTYFATGSAVDYINQVATDVPYRHNMLSAFVGNITLFQNSERITRYAAEGAAIAYAKSGGFNLTNIPVVAESFSPVLSESNLDLLKGAGFVTLMRYIKNDISVYQGTTTYAENTFLYSSKVAEISSIAYDYCFQFFGMVFKDGPQTEIETQLLQRLTVVEFVKIISVSVNKYGEEMLVEIEGLLDNEILEISFTIQNK